MRNSKYGDKILVGIFVVIAVLCALLGNGTKVQAGGSCLALGIAIMCLAWVVKSIGDKQLFDFEVEGTAILKDIAEKDENSEYYGVFNFEILNKMRNKLIKRNRKQMVSCLSLGAILIIIAIICII